jgi:NAD(P)-dependent dehydrogenase (short-subunit alcohol dehydrogenase family)
MQSKVKDAVAIITGGSKGYGAGIAEVLKENGANVWITGRDRNALESTAERLGVNCVAADVTRPADWDRVFEEVLGDAGRLDILVNNAGGGGRVAPMTHLTDESISDIIAVNLTGHLFGSRRAAEVMQRNHHQYLQCMRFLCMAGMGPVFRCQGGNQPVRPLPVHRAARVGRPGNNPDAILGCNGLCFSRSHRRTPRG